METSNNTQSLEAIAEPYLRRLYSITKLFGKLPEELSHAPQTLAQQALLLEHLSTNPESAFNTSPSLQAFAQSILLAYQARISLQEMMQAGMDSHALQKQMSELTTLEQQAIQVIQSQFTPTKESSCPMPT